MSVVRRVTIAWLWLAIALSLVAAVGYARASPETTARISADNTIDKAGFQRNGRAIVRQAFAAGSGDTYRAMTLFPSMGVLYLHRQGGGLEQCSGVVVGARQILTAAHCVCGRPDTNPKGYRDAAACQAAIGAIEGRFFSPVAGFASVRGAPKVHPDYRFPQPATPGFSATVVADVALVETDTPLAVQPAMISEQPAQNARYAFAAIGPYAPLPSAATARFIERDYPLVAKATLLQSADLRQECGQFGAADTLCTLYVPFNHPDVRRRSTSACPSDSGGGLFRFDTGVPGDLVGLASYVWPAHGPAGCNASIAQQAFFVDLTQPELRAWIAARIEPGRAPSVQCDDGVLFPDPRPYLLDVPGLVSLSLISLDETTNFQISKTTPLDCQATAVVAHCAVPNGPPPQIFAFNRGAQITLCWRQEG